jgi:hypothetical protein
MSYKGFRNPKTLSEKKESVALVKEIRLEDLPIKYRAKRSSNNLPDSWWDIHRKLERTWKKFRRHQYKYV